MVKKTTTTVYSCSPEGRGILSPLTTVISTSESLRSGNELQKHKYVTLVNYNTEFAIQNNETNKHKLSHEDLSRQECIAIDASV